MSEKSGTKPQKPDWYLQTAKFSQSDTKKAVWQLINTLIPYGFLWAVMIYLVKHNYPYWSILLLSFLAAGFLVRIFIFFHDCCHNSFFKSPRANRITGYITGLLTFTPFEKWQRSHAIHHATAGDLDKRGTGDVWTMTVEEYRQAPLRTRLGYRLYRNPLVMFGLGPIFTFLLENRIFNKSAKKQEKKSVIYTNIALLLIIIIFSLTLGLREYLMIQLPIIYFAGILGIWLFYVQHQFENVYWARHDQWDPIKAALEGSSYYKLPKILQWFSGNIGLHHIHHIRSNIPNYNLQASYNAIPVFQQVKPLKFFESLKCLGLKLYDEKKKVMVGFSKIR